MMEIERPKIETASLSPDGRYGKFVAEPLERCLLYTSVLVLLWLPELPRQPQEHPVCSSVCC